MSNAAPWQRLSPRARRAILLTSFAPPLVLILVFTPVYLMYMSDPTQANLALLAVATVLLLGVALGLVVSLLRILMKEPASPKRPKMELHQVAKFGAALVVFVAVYFAAIYAVVFGLQPLDESSESGAIAATLILLAVMVGLPIAFYFGLRAMGFKDAWTSGFLSER